MDPTQFNSLNSNSIKSEYHNYERFEIICQTQEECKLYVEYLNYVSNLVKSKLYTINANKILISNY